MEYYNNHKVIWNAINIFKENNEIKIESCTTKEKTIIKYIGINKNFTIRFINNNFHISVLNNVNELCKKYNLEIIKPITI